MFINLSNLLKRVLLAELVVIQQLESKRNPDSDLIGEHKHIAEGLFLIDMVIDNLPGIIVEISEDDIKHNLSDFPGNTVQPD